MARRRRSRKARKSRKSRSNPRRRHRRLRRNIRRTRRGRRLRRNPSKVRVGKGASVLIPTGEAGAVREAVKSGELMRIPKRKYRRLSKAQRRTSKALRKRAKSLRSRTIKRWPSKSALAPAQRRQRRAALAQAGRMSALASLAPRRPAKSALAKAMHIKTNPGLAGLMESAKVLLPQAGVGAVSMFGLAMVGKKVSDMVADKLPVGVQPYTPAIATSLISVGAYMAADKFAPKFKGAIALGGLIAAVLQALAAARKSATASPDGLPAKAAAALGLGDYTTVGGRSYADAGIFRDVGDYTTVGAAPEARDGGAYSRQRPRRGEQDNNMEWATNGLDDTTEFSRDSIHGLDDTTEFAPGEGGILSGGMFRGPSSR